MSLWLKLNELVPEPQCSTRGDEITEWHDDRPQPSQAEIDAVDLAPVYARMEAQADLSASDAKMARIAEDLVDTLIAGGVIAMADLPEAAQNTITKRKADRAKL